MEKIYLKKNVIPEKMIRFLYKETSLQYFFKINFTMLDNGRFPKVFTWKQLLQAHIDHEKIVYRRSFEYDIKQYTGAIRNFTFIICNLCLLCFQTSCSEGLQGSPWQNGEASEGY